KIAIAVLGALPSAQLARAIVRRDLSALTAVSGIGKKIAERLLLELRDKLPVTPQPSGEAGPLAPAAPKGAATDGERLRGALTGMGFRPVEADRAITTLADRDQGAPLPFEALLREALALLAK
ncbi:MAG: helix-hairpin-helix domain-containing protein, partial [Polyangiaceae bacterium]